MIFSNQSIINISISISRSSSSSSSCCSSSSSRASGSVSILTWSATVLSFVLFRNRADAKKCVVAGAEVDVTCAIVQTWVVVTRIRYWIREKMINISVIVIKWSTSDNAFLAFSLISSIKLMKSSSEVKRHFENLILSLSLHAHCLVVSGLQTKENLWSVIRCACLNLTLYV